jgi:predicted ester cyclase
MAMRRGERTHPPALGEGYVEFDIGPCGGGVTDQDPRRVVERLIDEVMNAGDLAVLDDLYAPRLATAARAWIEPFLASFSDVQMRVVQLVSEGDTVVGRFTCSGTHTGAWLGHAATGRRFEGVAEVYFFSVAKGRIVRAWGLEDTLGRLHQLGLTTEPMDGAH